MKPRAVTCAAAQPLLSSYMDRALTGRQMQDVEQHLLGCAACRRQYESFTRTQRLVSTLGRKPAPADLALRLRVAVSREAAQAHRSLWEGWRICWQNAVRAFMVPAAAGALSAVISFGLLIGFFALPSPVAAPYDVPTSLYTPPELRFSPFEMGMNFNGESIVVEAFIDAAGRVQDYRVISAPQNIREYLPQLQNMLIFTVFRPATAFGQPTSGRAVLSFSKINVKG
jgi:hypothetical protein